MCIKYINLLNDLIIVALKHFAFYVRDENPQKTYHNQNLDKIRIIAHAV